MKITLFCFYKTPEWFFLNRLSSGLVILKKFWELFIQVFIMFADVSDEETLFLIHVEVVKWHEAKNAFYLWEWNKNSKFNEEI